jgi:hypothetical protein
MPSDDLIDRFVPLLATATARDRDGDQSTSFQMLAEGIGRLVHVMPSDDVTTRSVPETLTAINRPMDGAQHTL